MIVLAGDMNGVAAPGNAPHDGIVANGQLTYVPKSNGESTAIGGAQIDSFYLTDQATELLTDGTSTVIRNDFFGESEEDFRAAHSDHFPVFLDLDLAPAPPTPVPASSPAAAAMQGLLLLLIGAYRTHRRGRVRSRYN